MDENKIVEYCPKCGSTDIRTIGDYMKKNMCEDCCKIFYKQQTDKEG